MEMEMKVKVKVKVKMNPNPNILNNHYILCRQYCFDQALN